MKNIVIYEQDYLTRTLLLEWLSEAGYRARLGRLTDTNRKWTADLIIADVYMPKRAGAVWIRDIQTVHGETPLIAISGQFRSGLSSDGAIAASLGVRHVIAKPLIRRGLLEAVRGIIGVPT